MLAKRNQRHRSCQPTNPSYMRGVHERWLWRFVRGLIVPYEPRSFEITSRVVLSRSSEITWRDATSISSSELLPEPATDKSPRSTANSGCCDKYLARSHSLGAACWVYRG